MVATAVLGIGPGAAPASAHTTEVTSEPAPGEAVEALHRVVLRFGEPVERAGSALWLVDDAGALVLPPPTHPDGDRTALMAPTPAVGRGAYSVAWRVVGEDASVVWGTFRFVYGDPVGPLGHAGVGGGGGPLAESHLDPRLGPARLLARTLVNLGLAVALGAAVFLAVVWPAGTYDRRARGAVWAALGVATGAGLGLVAMQLAVVEGRPLPGTVAPWRLLGALDFRFGRIALARLGLLGAAAVLSGWLLAGGARAAASWAWRVSGAAVALGLLYTLGATGHSASAGPLAMAARLVHVGAVAVWLGGLALIVAAVVPRHDGPVVDAVLRRFSSVAAVTVFLLAWSGLVMAVELLGSPVNLATTPYGRTLALKAVVTAGVLVTAARIRTSVRARAPLPSQTRPGGVAVTAAPVATWLACEIGLLVAVVGISALLTAQPPPA